jgi:hypothetical protein
MRVRRVRREENEEGNEEGDEGCCGWLATPLSVRGQTHCFTAFNGRLVPPGLRGVAQQQQHLGNYFALPISLSARSDIRALVRQTRSSESSIHIILSMTNLCVLLIN